MDSFSSAGEMSQSLELPLLLQANVDAEHSHCRQLRTFASWPFQSGAFYRRLLDTWNAATDQTDLAGAAIWFTGPGDTRSYMPWPIGLADQLHRSGHHPYLLSDLEIGPSRESSKTTALPQSLYRRLAALLPQNPCGVGTDLEGVRTISNGGELFADELDQTDPSWTLLLSAPLPPAGEGMPSSREIDGVVLVVPFEKYPDDAVRAATAQILDAGLTILGLISVGPTSGHGFVPKLVPAPGRTDRAHRNRATAEGSRPGPMPIMRPASSASPAASPTAPHPPEREHPSHKVHRVDLRRARPPLTSPGPAHIGSEQNGGTSGTVDSHVADSGRYEAEHQRHGAETARDVAETQRHGAETARDAAETQRHAAEARRNAAEEQRHVETERDTAETRRLTAEAATRIAREVSGETAAEIARTIAREVALEVAQKNALERVRERTAESAEAPSPPPMSKADAEAIAEAGAKAARSVAEEVAREVAETVAGNVSERSAGSVTRITEALARQTAEKAARQAADEIARRVATEVAEGAAVRSADDVDAKIARSEESSARTSSEIAARVAEETATRTTSEVATRIARTVASEEARAVAAGAIREAIEHVTRLAAEAAVARVRPMIPTRTDGPDYVYEKSPRSLLTEVASTESARLESSQQVFPGRPQMSPWQEQEQERARKREQAREKEKAQAAQARALSPPAPLEEIGTRGEFAIVDRWMLQGQTQRRRKRILGFVLVTVIVIAMAFVVFVMRPSGPAEGATSPAVGTSKAGLATSEPPTADPNAVEAPPSVVRESAPTAVEAPSSVVRESAPTAVEAPPTRPALPASSDTGVAAQGGYVVQLASFRLLADAQTEGDRLESLGVPTRVVEVELGKKGRWYRVVTPGVSDLEAAQRLRGDLSSMRGMSDVFVVDEGGRGSMVGSSRQSER